MNKILIGAGVAALVALGYAFFRYEHRCPSPAELDKIIGDVKSNKVSHVDAENIARELDRRGCGAEATAVRMAVSSEERRDAEVRAKVVADAAAAAKVIADAAAKAKALADAAAAEAAKPKCPPIFLRLPDAPMRKGRGPGDAPPYGVTSIRKFATDSVGLSADVRDSHAKILEDEAPSWAKEGISGVFLDAAKCLRGLIDAPKPKFYGGVAGMDPRRAPRWR